MYVGGMCGYAPGEDKPHENEPRCKAGETVVSVSPLSLSLTR